jgi:hypothetical protein
METPVFKIGMFFSSMNEFRKALTTCSVNEREREREDHEVKKDCHPVH